MNDNYDIHVKYRFFNIKSTFNVARVRNYAFLTLVMLSLALSGTVATAQNTTAGETGEPADAANMFRSAPVEGAFEPYIATIQADSVYVRSNPGNPYHPVCKLSKGHKVVVRDVRYGDTDWAKIEPTAGCFCYISKKYVKLQGVPKTVTPAPEQAVAPESDLDTTPIADTATAATPQPVVAAMPSSLLGREVVTGLLTGVNVRVRSGSIRVKPQNTEHLSYLSAPATVKIIGQSGDFYKIIPPTGSHFWIALDYLKKVGPATDAQLTQLRADAVKNALGMADPVATSDLNQKYIKLAQMFELEQSKPLVQRNLAPMVDQVEKLAKEAKSPAVKAAIQGLADGIARAQLAQSALIKSKEDDKKLMDKLLEINQKAMSHMAEGNPSGQSANATVVTGRLAPSSVFTATNQNRRYLVLDQRDNISCYAISEIPGLDLGLYVGKTVKLFGATRFDSFSKINLFYVTRVMMESTSGVEKDDIAPKESDAKSQ
ncbi:MAG: SH3 domain-containing protein [Phycisphaerae bacterium]|nr:SH3 domain-containing protein [Phycisphaerae bacterium]